MVAERMDLLVVVVIVVMMLRKMDKLTEMRWLEFAANRDTPLVLCPTACVCVHLLRHI